MALTFSLHDSIDPNGFSGSVWSPTEASRSVDAETTTTRIREQKIKTPVSGQLIARPRLEKLLEKSLKAFPATLISGRAGTGKTTLAAEFAKKQSRVAWYSVDSTDTSWTTFAAHFTASIESICAEQGTSKALRVPANIEEVLTDCLQKVNEPTLIVLDSIHHVFDSAWFDEFFSILIRALPANAHLLLLSRTKPPGPIWRMRSKGMLNVIDETTIAFSPEETSALLKSLKIPAMLAPVFHATSFGRISKILQFAGNQNS